MSWQKQLNGDSMSWLLEADEPGVRHLALRDLLDMHADDVDLLGAQERAYAEGPISTILGEMDASGFWVKEGSGYYPKYRGTVWSLMMLAQLGASIAFDKRIQTACDYVLDNTLTKNGQFSVSGAPSGTIDCLQGNLCAAMLDLGVSDPRLDQAFEWMARSVTGEGVAPMKDKNAPLRYYAGKCGPDFVCGANNKLPCAWGTVKIMLAFSKLPLKQRSIPLIESAILKGVDFLLGTDPAEAAYPTGWSNKPSGNWWKFGFPVFYVTDILQNVEAFVRLGFGKDSRLSIAIKIIREKQDENGRWALEYDYSGKIWVDLGKKKQPNKWVTFRAAWVLKNI